MLGCIQMVGRMRLGGWLWFGVVGAGWGWARLSLGHVGFRPCEVELDQVSAGCV